jgi:branched-chain amino acid transport system permease protein
MINVWPIGLWHSLKGIIVLVVPVLVLTVAAHFFFSDSTQSILTNLFINLIAVLGLYMFIGTSGVPSFGHVAFMGIAAHLQALLTLDPAIKAMLLPNLPPWLAETELSLYPAMLITVVFVGVFALLIGIPFSRMGDAATGIVTLCFLAVIHNVLNGWETFTAGVKVLYGIPEYCGLWTAFGLSMLTIFVARFFRDSAAGLELRASREDKEAAQCIGVNVSNLRLQAWVLSAMVMAVAGVLLVHFLTIVNPLQFYLGLTFSLIAMLIVGGLSTVSGVVLGTFFMTVVIEILRRIGEGVVIGPIHLPPFYGLTLIGTGAAIIVVMFWRPDGLIAFFEIEERIANWRRRGARIKHVQQPVISEQPLPQHCGSTSISDTMEVDSAHRLVIKHVSKNFGGLRAVDNVSLDLKQGEILGLIGPNGSGKTTLINVISGTLALTAGNIFKDDTDISNWPAHQIARIGIGRTFQSIQLFTNLTVLENIVAGAALSESRHVSIAPLEWAIILLSEFGLEEYAFRLAGTLPYGPQRSLEIARAVATQPSFLLLDEPATGMIRKESDQLIDILHKLRTRYGLGLLVVDHDLQMIMRLCDRIVVLNKGQVIASGTSDYVQRDPKVIEAYIGRKRKTGDVPEY